MQGGRGILLAAVLYALAALVFTWPLARHLDDHLIAHDNPAGMADSPLNAWILAWGFHALTHAPSRLFQANIFYPAPDALAFSDTLLGNQLLFAPVYAVTGNPVLSYNLTLLGAFVLNGLSLGLLARSITGQALPALVAGFLYAFAPVRFPHLIHLQLLSAWWAPLAFLALDAYLHQPRASRLAAAALMAWCQFLSSAYLGLMLLVLLVPYAVWRGWPHRRRLLTPWTLLHLALAGGLALILYVPVTTPYLRSQGQWGHERGLNDQLHYSAQPASFLAADKANWLYGRLTRSFRRQYASWETSLFLGLVPLGLAGLALLPRRLARDGTDADPSSALRGYVLVMGLAALLSLGPILIWHDEPAQWPLPYLSLFLWAPGFRAMRVPARFFLVGLVPLAALAGVGTARLLSWTQQRRPAAGVPSVGLATAALLAGLTVESLHTPIPLQRMTAFDEREPVSAWLAEAGRQGAILEIPFSSVRPIPEALRMLRSTRHWAPMVNGYSGFRPGSYFELEALVNGERESDQVLAALAAVGVRTLVVHLDELREPDRNRWLQEPPWSSRLRLLRAGRHVRLYRITPQPSRSASLEARLAVPATLRARDRFLTGLHLEERSGAPWVNPGFLGRQPLALTWKPKDGSGLIRREVAVYLPTVLSAGGRHLTAIPLETPERSGLFLLEVAGAGFRAEQAISVEEVAAHGGRPRAEITWMGTPTLQTEAGGRAAVPVRLRNLGDAIWRESAGEPSSRPPLRRLSRLGGLTFWWASADLPDRGTEWPIWGAGQGAVWVATPTSYLGKFTLRGRWLRDGQSVLTAITPLPHDVFPDQALDVYWILPAPRDPGLYELELAVQAPPLEPFFAMGGGGLLKVPAQIHPRGRNPA